MEEYAAICICGWRVVIRLGSEAQLKTCPQCGAPIRIPAAASEIDSAASVESEFEPSEDVALFFEDVTTEPVVVSSINEDSVPAQASPQQKEPVCARCGRIFRGEWDQVETDTGLYCHVCANLAFETAVKKEANFSVQDTVVTRSLKPMSWNVFDQKQIRDEREYREDGHKKWEMIALSVLAVITLSAIYFWPEHTEESTPKTITTEFSPIMNVFLYILIFIIDCATVGTTIYLTLHQTSRLEPGGWRTNLPSVLLGAFLVSLVWLGAAVIPIPLAPQIIALLITVVILDNFYGFWGMDFVYYMVIGVFVKMLFWGIRALLFGAINALAS